MAQVKKVKISIHLGSGKFEEDGETIYAKPVSITYAIDDAVMGYAHFNRIKIKMYDLKGKLISEKIKKPSQLFNL